MSALQSTGIEDLIVVVARIRLRDPAGYSLTSK
jgi:hypothetical protein